MHLKKKDMKIKYVFNFILMTYSMTYIMCRFFFLNLEIFFHLGTVPFYCNSVTILPKVPDRNMKVSVNEESDSQPSLLTVGETVVSIKVLSADGSNSQVITQTATVLATFLWKPLLNLCGL